MKTPESMQRLEELFHDAARLNPQARVELFARVRRSDPDLARAVESLIEAHEHPESFIDNPAYEAAAEMIAEAHPALEPGQAVGHYTIISPLGKGGMGEVYLASDTKLDRKVALKLLPVEFTNDKERLRRFIQEAKAASSLNHPNIITIHEIGEVDGAHFIATEFIDGLTLKQRIGQAKMTIPEILEVSIQTASALQAAHEAGIVHRDIKPENIMVRPDGYVKVLDFGLAKLFEKTDRSRTAALEVDTIVNDTTRPGTVLGTVNYMSPEQARGKPLDHRTDIFSFGIVLYEITAGRAPFAAPTSADILVSILEKDPPALNEYALEVPDEFQRIITKTLQKDREVRYQTIKELRIDLKALKEELSFAERLGLSTAPGLTGKATNKSTVIQNRGTETGDGPGRAKLGSNRMVLVALTALLIAGLAIAGMVFWQRGKITPATTTPPTIVQRQLNYWITVQKYRDGKPFQEPFRLSDQINFEKDYRIRLTVTSAQNGSLYLLNEGPVGTDHSPTYNLMFPTSTANSGSAFVAENQQVQIPEQSWFQFDGQQGTEKIWVVWTEKEIPELEAIKGFANSKDRGVISSPGLRTAINQFLQNHTSSPSVERDQEKKETIVKASGEILVHVIRLEHH